MGDSCPSGYARNLFLSLSSVHDSASPHRSALVRLDIVGYGYKSAVINYHFVANDVVATDDAEKRMKHKAIL